jgi:mRNA interferase MazF
VSGRVILQGEVYICSLDGKNSEQNGSRPCLVIQVDVLNRTSKNVIIVPITSKRKKRLPTHVELLKTNYPFLIYQVNTVLCENIRSISKYRLEKKLGTISKEDLLEVLKAKEYAFIEQSDEKSSYIQEGI